MKKVPMRIFPKFLLVFLGVSLIPLLILMSLYLASATGLGRALSGSAAGFLYTEARCELQKAVEDYAGLTQRQIQILEMVLKRQAQSVEKALREPDPDRIREAFLSDDNRSDMILSPLHATWVAGVLQPSLVSLQHVDMHLAPGVDSSAVKRDIAALAGVLPAYRYLWREVEGMAIWMFTGLESGVVSGYPGSGGYPENYDPRNREWYIRAKERGKITWNPSYVDVSGMGIVTCLSMPVWNPDRTLAGVTAIDLSFFENLQTTVLSTRWSSELNLFVSRISRNPETDAPGLQVISRADRYATGLDWKLDMTRNWLTSPDGESFQKMTDFLMAGRAGVLDMPFSGIRSLWCFASLAKESDCAVVMIVPVERILREAESMKGMILSAIHRHFRLMMLLALVGGLAVWRAAVKTADRVTTPVRRLTRIATRIARGDLNQMDFPSETGDEIGNLVRAVQRMQKDLNCRISELTRTVAWKERMQSELAAAETIQHSFLPRTMPESEGNNYEVFGQVEPFEEAGGDFYDFFLPDPRHLFFVIGDVSGKGVPAALFMALAKSTLQSLAYVHRTPENLLSEANRVLCKNNPESMFAALLCGVLDLENGRTVICNAGHPPPLVMDASGNGIFLKMVPGIALGVWENAEYQSKALVLEPGGGILMCTDGLASGRRDSTGRFSLSGLQETLAVLQKENSCETARQILPEIFLRRPVGHPDDDAAALMIRYTPAKPSMGTGADEGES